MIMQLLLLTGNHNDEGDRMIEVFLTTLPNSEMQVQTDVVLAAASGYSTLFS